MGDCHQGRVEHVSAWVFIHRNRRTHRHPGVRAGAAPAVGLPYPTRHRTTALCQLGRRFHARTVQRPFLFLRLSFLLKPKGWPSPSNPGAHLQTIHGAHTRPVPQAGVVLALLWTQKNDGHPDKSFSRDYTDSAVFRRATESINASSVSRPKPPDLGTPPISRMAAPWYPRAVRSRKRAAKSMLPCPSGR